MEAVNVFCIKGYEHHQLTNHEIVICDTSGNVNLFDDPKKINKIQKKKKKIVNVHELTKKI